MSRALVLLAALVVIAGCGGKSASTTTGASGTTLTGETTVAKATDANGCAPVTAPVGAAKTAPTPTAPLDATKTYDVTFTTNCGSFTVRLDQKQSPNVAASIVSLVQHGFYGGTVFHRIVPGFVIQGGDPTGTGSGGPGYSTVDTPPAGAQYLHGVVAMAKTGAEVAGTAGSQFFVVTGANVGLPADYAIIGTVTKGLDVIDHIGTLGDPSTEQPTEVVEIEKATVSIS
ncbi:MAG: peptidylprolyl isomerase [Actinomycetes bacterium]